MMYLYQQEISASLSKLFVIQSSGLKSVLLQTARLHETNNANNLKGIQKFDLQNKSMRNLNQGSTRTVRTT